MQHYEASCVDCDMIQYGVIHKGRPHLEEREPPEGLRTSADKGVGAPNFSEKSADVL